MTVRSLMLFALIALAGLSHAQPAPPASQSATLTDGTVVTLEGVTYGKDRRFHDMAINQLAGIAPLWPDKQDAIILWIRGIRPAGPTAQMGVQPGAIRIYDETGKEYVACEMASSMQDLSGNRHAIILYAWPRRSAQVFVDIPYSFLQPNHLTRFIVRNPQPLQTPSFPPIPAPITRRDGELDVTLDGLYQITPPGYSFGSDDRKSLLERGQKLHTQASFHYRFRGQDTMEWLPTEALITDSVGNPYKSQASNLYQPPQYPLTYYRSDSGEPLKMAVWFQRTGNASFAPHEIGVMNSLPMRYGSYSHTPGATTRIGNVTLELSSSREIECVGKRTQLTVNVYGGDPHLGLLLQVRNERGKSANGIGPTALRWITSEMREPSRFLDQGTDTLLPHRCVDFMMDLPRGTSRITCTIAVNQAHYFEFTPTPTILPPLLPFGSKLTGF